MADTPAKTKTPEQPRPAGVGFQIAIEDTDKIPASIGHKWSTASDKEWDWFRLVCKHFGLPEPSKTTKQNHAFRYAIEMFAVALEEGKMSISLNVDPSQLTKPQDFDISKVKF